MTRHPRTGAAEQLPVSVREPVETRAAKGKIAPSRLLSSDLKLAQANLLKTEHRRWKRSLAMLRMGRSVDTPSLKGLTFASVG